MPSARVRIEAERRIDAGTAALIIQIGPILVGLLATVVSVLIGVLVGLLAGYFGGWADRLLSRATDVVFGFPSLIFMIALGAIIPTWLPRSALIVLVIGFFGWPPIARVVRGQTLLVKERNYVVASRAAVRCSPHWG